MMRLPRALPWLVAAACCGVAAGAATPKPATKPAAKAAGQTTYKWVDEQGVTHYGDGLPADAANLNASVLNRNGVVVRDIEAPKRPAASAEATAREDEATRQRKRDRFLLSTYTSAHDIEQLRDERVAQISAQVTATQGYIETVTQRLQTLRARAGNFRPYAASPNARRMPDALAAELVQAINEERAQREALAKRQHEIQATQDAFRADIERYRQLTGK